MADPTAMLTPPAVPTLTTAELPAGPRRYTRYTELPQYSFTGFDTLDQVKNAIRQIDQGRLDLASQLADAMTRDDRLKAALMLRCQGIDALPLQFTEGKGAKAADAVTELKDRWSVMFPKRELQKLRKWGHMLGLGVAENRWVYVPETGKLEMRLHTWHPRWLYFNWATRTWWMSAMEGNVELVPGTGQWVFYTPNGMPMANMSELEGLVRSLYIPWLLRQWSLRDSGRYGEAYGSVTKKARFPAGLNTEERDAFMRDVAALGSESTIGLPTSALAQGASAEYDVEFMEVTGTGGDFFEKMINLANVNLAVRIIGNNLTTEVKGGSYSAAFVHEHIRQDIIEDDTDSLADTLLMQSIRPWALFNYGNTDVAPRPKWHTAPPEDTKNAGESLEAFAKGVKETVLAGIPVDVQKLADKHGVPLREDADDERKRSPVPIDAGLVAVGIPTVNEGREQLGLEARDGGDEIPEVNPEPPPAPAGGGKKPEKKMKDDPEEPKTTPVKAQLELDKLVELATAEAKSTRAQEIALLNSIIDHAVDFDDLKAKLTVAYAKSDSKDFEEVLRKAMILSELAGKDFARTET